MLTSTSHSQTTFKKESLGDYIARPSRRSISINKKKKKDDEQGGKVTLKKSLFVFGDLFKAKVKTINGVKTYAEGKHVGKRVGSVRTKGGSSSSPKWNTHKNLMKETHYISMEHAKKDGYQAGRVNEIKIEKIAGAHRVVSTDGYSDSIVSSHDDLKSAKKGAEDFHAHVLSDTDKGAHKHIPEFKAKNKRSNKQSEADKKSAPEWRDEAAGHRKKAKEISAELEKTKNEYRKKFGKEPKNVDSKIKLDAHIPKGYKVISGGVMSDSQVEAYNRETDKINAYKKAGKKVPENILNGRHNLMSAQVVGDDDNRKRNEKKKKTNVQKVHDKHANREQSGKVMWWSEKDGNGVIKHPDGHEVYTDTSATGGKHLKPKDNVKFHFNENIKDTLVGHKVRKENSNLSGAFNGKPKSETKKDWHDGLHEGSKSKGTHVKTKGGEIYHIDGYDKKHKEWYGKRVNSKGGHDEESYGFSTDDKNLSIHTGSKRINESTGKISKIVGKETTKESLDSKAKGFHASGFGGDSDSVDEHRDHDWSTYSDKHHKDIIASHSSASDSAASDYRDITHSLAPDSDDKERAEMHKDTALSHDKVVSFHERILKNKKKNKKLNKGIEMSNVDLAKKITGDLVNEFPELKQVENKSDETRSSLRKSIPLEGEETDLHKGSKMADAEKKKYCHDGMEHHIRQARSHKYSMDSHDKMKKDMGAYKKGCDKHIEMAKKHGKTLGIPESEIMDTIENGYGSNSGSSKEKFYGHHSDKHLE